MPVTPAVSYLLLGLQDVQWAVGNSRGARKLARTPHVNQKTKKKTKKNKKKKQKKTKKKSYMIKDKNRLGKEGNKILHIGKKVVSWMNWPQTN
jgi:hypothetical protein